MIRGPTEPSHRREDVMPDDVATIHTDGAARGNPGPAAFAYVIERPGHPVIEYAEKLGTATNNVAEYKALVEALERAAKVGLRRLAVFSDSELMVKQFNGEYAVKNAELKGLYEEAQSLARRFDAVTLTHVRRAANRRADQLCNIALDGRPAAPSTQPSPAKSRAKAMPARNAGVDDEAVSCLRAAMSAWARPQANGPTPEQVWDQLWSVLEDGGVLKARKPK
jgi:ribonuclease HI